MADPKPSNVAVASIAALGRLSGECRILCPCLTCSCPWAIAAASTKSVTLVTDVTLIYRVRRCTDTSSSNFHSGDLMELIILAGLVGLGVSVYRSGKRTGSRKGYHADRQDRRRR